MKTRDFLLVIKAIFFFWFKETQMRYIRRNNELSNYRFQVLKASAKSKFLEQRVVKARYIYREVKPLPGF